jgi:Ribbon-helix-helix protein, copG family.
MSTLSRRINILLSPEQFNRLDTIAKARGTSIGALIRDAVEKLYFQSDEEEKLRAVRALASLDLPVSGWEQMERESMGGCEVD